MMTKEEYKKAVIAMWDSMRNDFFKGRDDCIGVRCSECPLSDTDAYCCDCCNQAKYIFDIYKTVEKWSNEHPPKHKISQLEYDILCVALDHECVEFGDFYMLSDILDPEAGYFEGAIYETNIIDYLKNCEVEDDEK